MEVLLHISESFSLLFQETQKLRDEKRLAALEASRKATKGNRDFSNSRGTFWWEDKPSADDKVTKQEGYADCINTVTSFYGEPIQRNIMLWKMPRYYGYHRVDKKDMKPGHIIILADKNNHPHHAVMVDEIKGDKIYVNYSNGRGVYKKHVDLNVFFGPKAGGDFSGEYRVFEKLKQGGLIPKYLFGSWSKITNAAKHLMNTVLNVMTPVKLQVTAAKESSPAKEVKSSKKSTGSAEKDIRKLVKDAKAKKDVQNKKYSGTAVYLDYPKFKGSSKNALVIGGFDMGNLIGGASLPVGHAATILIDKSGKATYYEYGRYTKDLYGKEQRPTVKGGNWRRVKLSRKKANESVEDYLKRIDNTLPDSHLGTYQATVLSNVDTKAAHKYVKDLANDRNREEYSTSHTCATEAAKVATGFVNPSHRSDAVNSNESDAYTIGARLWSLIPGSTGSYAKDVRKQGDRTVVINPED